jgi:hypothetical protein
MWFYWKATNKSVKPIMKLINLRRFISSNHDTERILFTFLITIILFDQITHNKVKMTFFLISIAWGNQEAQGENIWLCLVREKRTRGPMSKRHCLIPREVIGEPEPNRGQWIYIKDSCWKHCWPTVKYVYSMNPILLEEPWIVFHLQWSEQIHF